MSQKLVVASGLKEEVSLVDPPTNPAKDRIRILDEKVDEKVSIRPAKNRLKIKGSRMWLSLESRQVAVSRHRDDPSKKGKESFVEPPVIST